MIPYWDWDIVTLAESLCLALLHSLWQGVLWCVALTIVLGCVPASRPNLRYAASLACLIGLGLGVCVTLSILRLPQIDRVVVGSTSEVATSVDDQASGAHAPQEETAVVGSDSSMESRATDLEQAQGFPSVPWLGTFAPVLVTLWAAGAIYFLLKSFSGWRAAHRMCAGEPIREPAIHELLASLKERLGVRRLVKLVQSSSASGPFVIGLLQPMIVIPASLASGLTPDQWTMILGHELAHVRRWDYVVNFIQLWVEALLFFNPAVWWLSRQVRIEREACCDSCAVQLLASPLSYATALMEIGERLSPRIVPAFAAKDSRSLLDRIRRIVGSPSDTHAKFGWPMLALLLLVGVALVVLVQRGTDFAVTAAAQVLSDEQRVSELRKVAEEVSPTASPSSTKVLTGSVKTEDGSPLPATIHVTCLIKQDSSTSMITENSIESGKSSDFRYELGPGAVWLMFQSTGFATAVVGPITDSPDSMAPISVTLKEGNSATLRIIDDEGRPVPQATVSVMTQVGEMASGQNLVPHQSDSEGRLLLEHIDSDQFMRLSVTASGFQQRSISDVKLRANQVFDIQLSSAQLTSGEVIDSEGRAVQGAELFSLRRRAPGSNNIEGWLRTALARTDEQGQFKLDALLDGQKYDFVVIHPEHGLAFVRDVTAGQSGLEVRLPQATNLDVSIHGSDEQLERLNKSYIAFGFTPLEDAKYESDPLVVRYAARDLQVGGNPARYHIKGMVAGNLTLQVGDQKFGNKIVAGQNTLTIELSDAVQPQRRPVRLAFTVDNERVYPSGKLRVTSNGSKPTFWSESISVNLVDGTASFDTRTPCTLFINTDQLIGFASVDSSFNAPISSGTDEVPVTLAVQPAGGVKGRVLNADGSPAIDCSVSVRGILRKSNGLLIQSETSFGLHTRTNGQGEFFLTPIPFGSQCDISAAEDKNVQLGESFTINSQNPIGNFTLQLSKTVPVSIRVIDEQGNPVRGLPVSISLEHPRKSTSWSPPEISDPKGEITIDAINPELLPYFRAKAEPAKDYQVTGVSLNASGGLTEIRLVEGRVIQGQLVDANNRPLPSREMWAIRKGSYERFAAEARSDNEGRFRFSNLTDGEFTLQANGFPVGNEVYESQSAKSAQSITAHIK